MGEEKISGDIKSQAGLPKLATEEANLLLYGRVAAYLNVKSQTGQLNDILDLAQNLQDQELAKSKGSNLMKFLTPSVKVPGNGEEDELIWQNLSTQFQSVKNLSQELANLQSNVENGQWQEVFKNLVNLSKTAVNPESPLASQSQKTLQKGLAFILNGAKNTPQGPLGNLLLLSLLSSMSSEMQNQGQSTEDTKNDLQQFLKNQLNAVPPSNFALYAKNLLAQLQGPQGAKLWNQLLNNPDKTVEEQLETFKEMAENLNDKSIKQTLSSLMSALGDQSSPDQQLESYEDSLDSYWTEQYVREGTTQAMQLSLKGLGSMTSLLKQYAPENPDIEKLLSQIETLSQSFPNWSEASHGQFKNAITQFSQLRQGMITDSLLPPEGAQQIREMEAQILEEIMNSNLSAQQRMQQLSSQINQRLNTLGKVSRSFGNVTQVLQTMQEGKPTSREMLSFSESIESIVMAYPNLTDEEKEQVDHAFEDIGQMTNSKGQSAGEVLGDCQLAAWINHYAQENDPPTLAGLKQFLNKANDAFAQSSMDNTLYNDMRKSMAETLPSPNFAQFKSSSGTSFGQVSGNTYNSSYSYWEEMMMQNMFSFPIDAITQGTNGSSSVQQALSKAFAHHKGHYKATQRANQAHAAVHSQCQASSDSTNVQTSANESLPELFAKAILDCFMPQQQNFLMQLAGNLFFNNMGAQIGNDLLNSTTGWENAGNNYGFGNWLNAHSTGSTNQYYGTISQYQKYIQNELNQAKSDEGKANSALNTVNSEIAKVQNKLDSTKPPLTGSQRSSYNKLLSQLNSFANQLTTAISNLKTLTSSLSSLNGILSGSANALSSAGITVGTGPDGQSAITFSNQSLDSVNGITSAESPVVNGNTTNITSSQPLNFGGLENIESNINTFQGSYASTSQTDNIMLQQRMTIVQMEWSMTTTAMTTVNQMYMTPLQAISPS